MQFETKEVRKDLVVVGAGMPGLVAAIQAARLGVTVAVICDRGYLGGNASAEIRVPVSGADGEQELNFYSREGGILEEIRLENLLPTEARVTLHDQIPVPRHEDVKVKLEFAEPKPAEQTGLNMLEWEFTLPPGEKRNVRFEFSVEHPREMSLVGLP